MLVDKGIRRGGGWRSDGILIVCGRTRDGMGRGLREREQVGRQGLSHSPWRPADNVLVVVSSSGQQYNWHHFRPTTGVLLLPSSKPPPSPASKGSAVLAQTVLDIGENRATVSAGAGDGKRCRKRVISVVVVALGEEEREVRRCPVANASRGAAGTTGSKMDMNSENKRRERYGQSTM